MCYNAYQKLHHFGGHLHYKGEFYLCFRFLLIQRQICLLLLRKKYDIHVVSFVNLVNGKELVCFDPDLSPEEELAKGKEYYNAMRTGCEIKTGLISTANFADAFRTALEADQDVIYLP